jgi:PBSX family phage terminase large subunit
MITVQWCEWKKIINTAFDEVRKQIDKIKYRYVILYGGRGSSKSDFIAKYLIFRCLSDKYFRFILIRNTYNTIKDSQYQTIKDIIEDLGLSELFEFKLNPLEIHCYNGNRFLARGCDDTTRLKSVKDPTGAWYEEDIPSESDFITITTGIRTSKADQLMEIFTINPEVEGDFQDHWFWKKFFLGQQKKTFEGSIKHDIEGREIELKYLAHWSDYTFNRWLPDSFKAFLEALKKQDPYYYTIYCLGEWGNRITGGAFYKAFNRGLTVTKTEYDPSKSLHISFDFNTQPYMSASIWQISNNMVYNIAEIAAVYPKNTTVGICNEIKAMFSKHQSGMFIYGDRNGKNEDTRSEKGKNDFTLIEEELKDYKPSLRIPTANPSVEMRGKWINALLADLRDIKVFISEESPLLIADLLNLKEAADGTKFKQKVKDEKTGVTYEKYGHFSDGMDYFLCEAFKSDYLSFQKGGSAFKPLIQQRFTKTNY